MLTAVQELKLIARCVAFDDRDAFTQLIEAYKDALYGFLYNLTSGNTYVAEEVSQEVFIKAWLSLRGFKGIARFKTWLFRIAYNEYVSYKRKEHVNFNEDKMLSLSDESLSVNIFEARMDVNELIKLLPDKERSVVLLFYMEDMPIKQIVKVTGMPEGTIKVYLSRAREKLIKFVKDDEKVH